MVRRSCLRLQQSADHACDKLSVGTALRLRDDLRHHELGVLWSLCARLRDDTACDLADLLFVELFGKVSLDDRELLRLFLRELVAARFAERLDRVTPHLGLLREHFLKRGVIELTGAVRSEPRLAGGLVLTFRDEAIDGGTEPRLLFVLDRGEQKPERVATQRVARAHRGLEVVREPLLQLSAYAPSSASALAALRFLALATSGGALVELAPAGLGEDPCLLDLLVEAAKRGLERLAIADDHFRQRCWSPRLLFKGKPAQTGRTRAMIAGPQSGKDAYLYQVVWVKVAEFSGLPRPPLIPAARRTVDPRERGSADGRRFDRTRRRYSPPTGNSRRGRRPWRPWSPRARACPREPHHRDRRAARCAAVERHRRRTAGCAEGVRRDHRHASARPYARDAAHLRGRRDRRTDVAALPPIRRRPRQRDGMGLSARHRLHRVLHRHDPGRNRSAPSRHRSTPAEASAASGEPPVVRRLPGGA